MPNSTKAATRRDQLVQLVQRTSLPAIGTISELLADNLRLREPSSAPAESDDLSDLVWHIRGALRGLLPARLVAADGVETRHIQFLSRNGVPEAVQVQSVAVVLRTAPVGRPMMHLAFSVEVRGPAPIRILVVEDDVHVARLQRQLLEQAGFVVLAAADGVAGLRLAQTEQPGALLLDCDLPLLDGVSVCQTLKANATTRSIPIICCSGRVAAREAALAAGADEFLAKPEALGLIPHRLAHWLWR